jgi:hypothetical protein
VLSKSYCNGYTVRSLINRDATVTSRLLAGTAWLTAKRCKVFSILVKYRSIKTIKSSSREPLSDNCVQLYQWTHCTVADDCLYAEMYPHHTTASPRLLLSCAGICHGLWHELYSLTDPKVRTWPLHSNLHDERLQSSGTGWVGVVNQVSAKHEKLPRVINPCLITTTQLRVSSKCPAWSEHNYVGWLAGCLADWLLHQLVTQSCSCLPPVLSTQSHDQPEWLMLLH